MKRRTKFAIVSMGLAVLGVLLGPYVISRVQWYNIENGWNGVPNLVACHSGTPLFAKIGMGVQPDLPSERTARFDAWIACRSINAHRAVLVSHKHYDGNNAALSSLVMKRHGCLDRRFDTVQKDLCESAVSESIDWLLEEGVLINPVGSCGYLRLTFTSSLDAKMFEFLLSRGASVEARCPAAVTENDDGLVVGSSTPMNVIDSLKLLSTWLDAGEFPEEAAQYARMIVLAEASLDET